MLTWLQLSGHHFEGTVPTEIGHLSMLEVLSLYDNGLLTGTIPTELNNLRNLGAIRLQGTNLVGDLTILCDKLPETASINSFGFVVDCLEEDEITCCCCVGCCDNSGYCERNDGSICS